MRKSTLLKVAGTFAAVMFSFGVMAQTHDGTAIPGQANVAAYGQDGTTYMVEGTTVPLYALPDPIYHPWNYATATWTLTDGFIWIWSEATTTLNFSQNNAQDNYVALTAPAGSAGTYTVNVLERAPAAFGGCDDGVGENITINVVETPDATLGALAGTTPNYCAGGATIPTTVPVTISGGWQNYRLVWRLEIATLDNALTKDFYYSDETGAGSNAVQFYAVNHTTTTFEAVAAAGVHNIMTVGSFDVIDNKPTVYTYELISINDQALRFGNFIALNGDATDPSVFDYNAIGETYTIQINPAPNTGPIYHIPTTWAN